MIVNDIIEKIFSFFYLSILFKKRNKIDNKNSQVNNIIILQ